MLKLRVSIATRLPNASVDALNSSSRKSPESLPDSKPICSVLGSAGSTRVLSAAGLKNLDGTASRTSVNVTCCARAGAAKPKTAIAKPAIDRRVESENLVASFFNGMMASGDYAV